MSFLPIDSFLGDLKIVEVYVFYDCPRLFACRNTCGQFFLAVWLEDTEEADLWLYVSLSAQRLAAIRTGQIDLYDAFRSAENHWVYQVTTYYDERVSKIETISCDTLDDDWLPERGQCLSGVSQTELTDGISRVTLEQMLTKINAMQFGKQLEQPFTNIGKKQLELKQSNELFSDIKAANKAANDEQYRPQYNNKGNVRYG
jgi:hypothetical protein